MSFKKRAARCVLWAGGVVLVLVLPAFAVVQIQQRMVRWRAHRLSAEMHQIRLSQSTWADAQRVMRR
jgi:membrane protein YdbS with pleckstrin-like domain